MDNHTDTSYVFVPPARRHIDAWADAIVKQVEETHNTSISYKEMDGLADFVTLLTHLGAKYLNAHNFDTPQQDQ